MLLAIRYSLTLHMQALLPEGAGAWPGARQLLLLQLWAMVFPASDRRHPVLTPAALLACAHLALCPIGRHADIAQGAALRCSSCTSLAAQSPGHCL